MPGKGANKLQRSLVCLGGDEARIDTISTALSLSSPHSSLPPSSSTLLGTEQWCTNLAQRLAIKTKYQVFIFADVLEDPEDIPKIEKVIFEKLKNCPELFLTS